MAKGFQADELSSTLIETQLKEQGLTWRGSEFDLVMEKLTQDRTIKARKSGVGHWYIETKSVIPANR